VVQPVKAKSLTPLPEPVKRHDARRVPANREHAPGRSAPPAGGHQRSTNTSRSTGGGAPAPRASRRRAVDRAVRLVEPIRKTRVAEEIADRIRVLILDGTLPTGQPLPGERLLAERFAVSRGSIRDALRMLETIGLLETHHGQGTFPRELDVNRLVAPLASVLTYRHDLRDELLDVRRMFEPAVARAAALRVTDDDLADLQRIVETQRRKLKSGRSAIVEDTAFHAVLARATRNRAVVRIMETLNNLLIESRTLTLKQKGRPERSIRGHEAVVEALRRRDPEATALAMHTHIDQIAELLQQTGRSRGQTRSPSE
jgi:GntR family transcriptional regulator, transcriptional repressor for pyruvate dehydrogenase complex